MCGYNIDSYLKIILCVNFKHSIHCNLKKCENCKIVENFLTQFNSLYLLMSIVGKVIKHAV